MQPHEPEENRPGHHPDAEQDKPDLDEFAAKFGTAPPGDETDGGTGDHDEAVEPGEPLPLAVVRTALDLGEVAVRTGLAVGGAVARPLVGAAVDVTGRVAHLIRR